MNQDLIVKAKDNTIRTSPLKLANIARSIVNKKADNAVNQLKFSNKRIANNVLKVLNAAIANAENNKQLDIDNLYIKEAFVGKSLSMKRFRPRAKGRASSIVNMKVSSAINQLKFSPKRISGTVLKVLNAAIANAENNKQLDIDNLYIKEAFVGKSLSMKRFRPRAKGRASSILKPFSKLTIILEERVKIQKGKDK